MDTTLVRRHCEINCNSHHKNLWPKWPNDNREM